MQDNIEIKRANVHNLRDLSVKIPKNKLVVLTGVSGSGKSSLAFDTLYAEGQRRYVESLSSYARQFLGLMEKPDVESITGLSPAISIDQKTSSHNPRSTVGTVTEIYDYLRLLFARIGITHCPKCGKIVMAQTLDEISNQIKTQIQQIGKSDIKVQILAPLIQNQKGIYTELFSNLLSKGFLRVRVDSEIHNLENYENIKLAKFKKHTIDLIIDRLVAPTPEDFTKETDSFKEFDKRLTDAIELSSNMAEGEIKVLINEDEHFYSENNTCTTCNISFPQIKPASFSFNAPLGACEKCTGIGVIREVDPELIYNPKLSILEGGIFPCANMTTHDTWTLRKLKAVSASHGFDLKTPIGSYTEEIRHLLFFGQGAKKYYTMTYKNRFGQERKYETSYEGVVPEIERRYRETTSDYAREEYEKYMREIPCSTCNGQRLKPYSLAVTVGDKNINEITEFQISDLITFLNKLKLKGSAQEIFTPIKREIVSRLKFLDSVGLGYLTLSRKANTLSGGESQRIRLASQIGTGLTGVLYVLDEPSIGLHARDVSKLIDTLVDLKELGNTVVVVEHDFETMNRADWIIDIGPEAGDHGGKVVAEGTLEDIKQTDSLTAKYLNKSLSIGQGLPRQLITESNPKALTISGVSTHNLKNVDVSFPLGKFVCVTGVSGSGKSSLVNDTLYPILLNEKMNGKQRTGTFANIDGMDEITKVIGIDQSPIGRTPRSNPATYTGLFTIIRELFAQTPEARARGYTPGRFSFNVKGGRCEKCKGDGQIKIEMQFLADMYITCEECGGKRYNKEALQIDYKGKNISDVLDMRVSEAKDFFANISTLSRKLELLEEVGLGYIKLGQSATELSGGESQRIKLSKELSKMGRGHTVYILDEPTTGLHFHDIDKLLTVLKKLVEKGHSVIVIEHNLDIIKFADWIIDMGPEGGDKGGKVVATGTVEDVMKVKASYTGMYLKEYLMK